MLNTSASTLLVTIMNLIILVTLFGIVPLCVGILVWRDAGRRGMQRLLWALVAALVPLLFGLVAYLISASQHKPQTTCLGCGHKVEQEFLVCPFCGDRLSTADQNI